MCMQVFGGGSGCCKWFLICTSLTFLCACLCSTLSEVCLCVWYCCSLQAIGNGAVAQSVLGPNSEFGEFLVINLGYALALMVACYVSIGISGAHLNPAVTWAMAIRGKMSWIKVPVFSF